MKVTESAIRLSLWVIAWLFLVLLIGDAEMSKAAAVFLITFAFAIFAAPSGRVVFDYLSKKVGISEKPKRRSKKREPQEQVISENRLL